MKKEDPKVREVATIQCIQDIAEVTDEKSIVISMLQWGGGLRLGALAILYESPRADSESKT